MKNIIKGHIKAVKAFMYSEVDLNPEEFKAYTENFGFDTGLAKRS